MYSGRPGASNTPFLSLSPFHSFLVYVFWYPIPTCIERCCSNKRTLGCVVLNVKVSEGFCAFSSCYFPPLSVFVFLSLSLSLSLSCGINSCPFVTRAQNNAPLFCLAGSKAARMPAAWIGPGVFSSHTHTHTLPFIHLQASSWTCNMTTIINTHKYERCAQRNTNTYTYAYTLQRLQQQLTHWHLSSC